MIGKLALLAVVLAVGSAPAQAADEYTVDLVHSSMSFKIEHLGVAFVHGRFNEFGGNFSVDADPAKCSFTMNVKVDSVDTANKMRDDHLKKADFFDAAKYPTITFKSTAIKAAKDGYEVTGDFTMHGVTKSIAFTLTGGKTVEVKGMKRIGYSTDLSLKRSDYGINASIPLIGDEVFISISFEGLKK
jgi:polyisoprenoid-binding protein YceI